MNRRIRLLVVTAALMVVAAACDDDDAGPAPTPADPPPRTNAAPQATAAPPTPTTGLAPETPVETTEPPTQIGPFEITTADGLILEAERFGVGEDFVVLAHMRPADMSSWFSFAALLGGEGYSAITFNFRGYGNSEGAGFAVDVDVVAAVDAAFALGAKRVFLIGASMGGTGAIAAAAQRDVAGVITLSAPFEFQGTDAETAAASAQTGMLLIAAEGDSPYNAHAEVIRSAAGGFAEVAIWPGRRHGTDMFLDHSEDLTSTILRYLLGQP